MTEKDFDLDELNAPDKGPDPSDMIQDTSSSPEVIFKCKWLGCCILSRILQIQNECRVNRILFQFKNISHVSLSKKRNEDAGLSKRALNNLILGIREEGEVVDQSVLDDFRMAFLDSIEDDFSIKLNNDLELSEILLKLTLNPDIKLKTEALRLLYYLHSQLNITKANIEEVVLLDSTNTKMSYNQSLNITRALCRLVETAEKWYEYPNRPELEVVENILHLIESHLLQENEKKAGFSPYTEVLIEHDESRIGDNDEFGNAEQYFCRELKGTINPFYQNIFRHLGVYKSLQAICKTDFSKFKNSNIRDRFLGNSGITGDMSQIRTPETNTKFFSCFSPRHRDLIRRIYTIFALACVENQENKNMFTELAKGMLFDHLNVDSANLAMYIFLCEYLTDNFQFVRLDEHQRFLEQIVVIMNSFPTHDIRKLILMNCLSNLTRYTGIINQQNQNYMFQKVIRLFNKVSMIDFNNPRNVDVIESKLVHQPPIIKYMNSEVMLQNYEIGYYAAFIKFIRRCGDGRNNLTENTAQILIPLRVIDRLFKVHHVNLDMYDQLLSLFYNIHLNTTKKMPIQFEEITVNIAYKLADQLQKFVATDNTTLHDLYRLSGIRLEKNDIYCIRYYSKVIECCYKILLQMATVRIVISQVDQEKYYSDLLEGVFSLYPQIADENHRNVCLHTMIHLMTKTPESMATSSKEKFQQIYKDLEDSVISKGIKAVAENNIKLTTKIIKHSLTIKKFYKHSSKSITMTTFRHKTRVVENLSEQGKLPIEAAFVEFMNMCKEDFFASREFKRLSEGEFHGLVETINNIDSENRKKAKKKNLGSKGQDLKSVSGFFNSMVQFLMWETEKIPEELIDILLQIFVDFVKGSNKTAAEELNATNAAASAPSVPNDPGPGSKQTSSFSSRTSEATGMGLLTKKGKKLDTPETDREKDEKEQWKSKKLLKYRQGILVDLNVAQLVCQLLTKDVSTEINIKAVKLAITVLDGGNHQAQQKFYEYFKSDPRNKVLVAIQELLDLNLEVVVNFMVGKNNKKLENILQEGEVKMNALSFAAAVTRELNAQKERESEESMSNIKSSVRLIKDVLRFLQLLCEGHYLDMQNYLRDQRYENMSLNRDFVSFGAKMLSTFVKINNKMSMELGIQLLEFLIELVQGPCIANQAQLVNIKVVDICKDLLDDISMKNSFKEIWDLDTNANQALITIVSKTTTLLASILEGNQEQTYIKSIANGLNLGFLEESLQSYLRTFASSKQAKYENNLQLFISVYKAFADREFFDEKIIDALQMYIFLKILKDYRSKTETKGITFGTMHEKSNLAVEGVTYNDEFDGASTRQELSPFQRKEQKAVTTFFQENTRMVEIVFQGSIQQVYFPVYPACRYLPGHKRDEFIKKFNRESPNEKMVQFMRCLPEWFDIMDYMITIKTSKIPITDTTLKWTRDITLGLSLLINLFYVFYSKLTVEKTGWRIEVTLPEADQYMLAANVLHLICTIFSLLVWLIVYGPIVQMDWWREKIKEIKKAIYNHPDQSEENEICKIIIAKNIFEQSFVEKVKVLGYYQNIKGKTFQSISSLDLISYFAYYTVMSPDFNYFMSLILFSSLGLGFRQPFFYAMQLWEVVDKFDTLKNVIKAFTHHKVQIISTLLLCIVIVHIFSIFAYYYVNETFYNYSVGAQGENLCVSVLHCFTTVFSLGPRSSGSVGDMLIRQSYSSENLELYMVRFFYDVFVFIIVNIIFLNMIMGVIIDTFAELRDEKNSTEENKRNVCFVCSISRGSLDKEAEGFEQHTRNVHFLWDYLYFVYYLKMKSVTEYSGIEMSVHAKIQSEDISWLPIQRTLAIEKKLGRKVLPEKNVENLEQEVDKVIQGTLLMR